MTCCWLCHNTPGLACFLSFMCSYVYPFLDLNSNHLPSYPLLSKGFSWFFYLGVHRGTGVFSWLFFFFFTPPPARDSLSHSPRACLRSTEKRWKIAFVLQIQASSMYLRVHCLLFLVFLYIKTDGKNKPFFLQAHQHSDKEVFLGVSRE